ncbi:ImmA/IrrE family metallo-endopeptidase [Actinomyces urogenitalis]|uniref:ImmA/IrrE family metallo-endopeptidase n=1 Tax=Actinomyces urogenitalis TaxID=103621 RepID=UPI00242AE307|nr:hypothetical protein [Actinomyces urogenitalis]MCI7457605.1 hypothetical protein [Actinomyces urogenitalis]
MAVDLEYWAGHLADAFTQAYGDLPDPRDDLVEWASLHLDGVDVSFTDAQRQGPCSVAGMYNRSTAKVTIHRSGNDNRDLFTLMHEIGHHLAYTDAAWQAEARRGRDLYSASVVEEALVNTFASQVLIGPRDPQFQPSARAILELALTGKASLSACCAWALRHDDPMLVMAGDTSGRVWFAASNTTDIRSPGCKVKQRQVEDMVDRHVDSHSGGYGLRYASGDAWTAAHFQIAYERRLTVTVVTTGRQGSVIGGADWTKWHLECARCSHQYIPKDGRGTCETCFQAQCPQCGGCDCPDRPSVCDNCFLTLTEADKAAGRTTHEEC